MGAAEPGIEIRRIILLIRLRDKARGMTMEGLVKDCGHVAGWSILGESLWEGVRFLLQSLIDDGLVAARKRFMISEKGRDYLEDPLKWRIDVETAEEVETKMFWKSIMDVFDKAYARLRSTIGSPRS